MSNFYLLAPIINGQHLLESAAAEGYLIKVFTQGTATLRTIYNGSGSSITNPVSVGPLGFPVTPIFLQAGETVDAVLTTSAGVEVRRWNGIHAGGGHAAIPTPAEWSTVVQAVLPYTLSASGRDLQVGLVTWDGAVLSPGRRVRITGGTTRTGSIVTTEYLPETGFALVVSIYMDAATSLADSITGLALAALDSVALGVPARQFAGEVAKFSGPVNMNNRLNLLPTGALATAFLEFDPDIALPCDGAAVSRTTQSALFAAIGTTFGVGDGSTTFNVPSVADLGSFGWFIYV